MRSRGLELEDRSLSGWQFFFQRTGGAVAWCGYIFLVLPSLLIIPISFGGVGEITFPPRTFSLALYQQFFSDQSWWSAALQSFRVASLSMLLSLMLAIPAAYALARRQFWGAKALNMVLLSPILVPVIVIGLGFYLHFSALGIVGSTLGLVLAHTILVSPFVIISVTSGLKHIDPALERAATIMGASRARIFLKVVLPQIQPAIAVGALFAFLISFDEVVVAYFIAGPNTATLPVKMYSAIRWEISPVIAAVSTLLTALSLVFCVTIAFLQRKK